MYFAGTVVGAYMPLTTYLFMVTAYGGPRDTALYEMPVTIQSMADAQTAFVEALKIAQHCVAETCAPQVTSWVVRRLKPRAQG